MDEEDIINSREYTLRGNTLFDNPHITILYTNDKSNVFYYDNDKLAEEAYNKIIEALSEKCPMLNIEKICQTT